MFIYVIVPIIESGLIIFTTIIFSLTHSYSLLYIIAILPERQLTDERLVVEIKKVNKESYGTYGVRRIGVF